MSESPAERRLVDAITGLADVAGEVADERLQLRAEALAARGKSIVLRRRMRELEAVLRLFVDGFDDYDHYRYGDEVRQRALAALDAEEQAA